ncbi:ArsR family transcriptional regulator [Candidatus Pacearchaeota archaeon]|nr:ArsR family transcriptional regulator [Candidatus Pacearchaeota archaeon]
MELLKAMGFIKRGKNRREIFINLDKPMMPSELVMKIYKSKSNTYFNLVSRALSELKEKKLVEIVNPEDRTGRIYKRTKEGEKVVRELI